MTSDTLLRIGAWLDTHPVLTALLFIWALTIKGIALWKAAEREQKAWFIALLVVNSFGILDLIYIFLIAARYKVEIVEN